MGKTIKQASWECSTEGILTGTFPGGLSCEFDLTKLYIGWADMDEAEMFYASYGVKQKSMDYSSDTKWTYADKIGRATELFNYAVKERKLPATKRGGFDIKKTVAKKVEKLDKPLTEAEEALLIKLGLI